MQKECAFLLSLLVVAMTLLCHAQTESEQEKNEVVARTFVEEVIGEGKLEKYSDFHTAYFVGHSAEPDFTLAEDLAAAREERTAPRDMQIAISHMVAEGDLVVMHGTVWGTNTQAGMGLPVTGKPVRISGMTRFRFKGERSQKNGTPGACSRC